MWLLFSKNISFIYLRSSRHSSQVHPTAVMNNSAASRGEFSQHSQLVRLSGDEKKIIYTLPLVFISVCVFKWTPLIYSCNCYRSKWIKKINDWHLVAYPGQAEHQHSHSKLLLQWPDFTPRAERQRSKFIPRLVTVTLFSEWWPEAHDHDESREVDWLITALV